MKNFQIGMMLFIAVIYGCQTSESTDKEEQGLEISYIAKIVDSVVIDRLSEVSMEAINPETSELLLFDEQKREMLVIDEEGNVLSSFGPFEEGPNYMGDQSTGWSFYGEDQILGFGSTHFYMFAKSGKRLKRIAHPIDFGGASIIMNYAPKRIIAYGQDDVKTVVVLFPDLRAESKTQAYQDSSDMVYNLDFENDKLEPVFRKPEQSVYRTKGSFLGSGYPAMDHINDGKFVVAYEADNSVYIMDAVTNTLEQTITLPEAYWPIVEPVDFNSSEWPEARKVVASVYSLGDQFMVKVFGRIPEFELKVLRKIPRYYESPELKRLEKKYNTIDMLLFNSDGFLGRVDWNLGHIDYRYFGDKNGFIWVKRNYKDERTYQTFLKIRIVPDN